MFNRVNLSISLWVLILLYTCVETSTVQHEPSNDTDAEYEFYEGEYVADFNETGPGGHGGLHDNHTEHEEHAEHRYHLAHFDFTRVATPYIIGVWIVFASLAKLVFHLNDKLSKLFPESCMLMFLGVVVGIILYFCNVSNYEMKPNDFFLYLLPPIVLDAGYFMPNRAFFDNLGTILLFAVIGTIWNTVVVGLALWGFSNSGGIGAIDKEFLLLDLMVFAALLAAVDPVAVIAVFEEVHVNEVLYIVVFGESLLNDGVTVVLYNMFHDFALIGGSNLIPIDYVFGILSFFLVAGLGTLIGIIIGFVCALITRFTDHVRVVEPLIVFFIGYLSYLSAEIFHFSGILACTFCGITMRKYVEQNMSPKSRTTTKYFIKMMASVCETIIFVYLGISSVIDGHSWDTAFVLLTVIFCIISRTAGVIIFGSWVNRYRTNKFSAVDHFIMSYGGLRGAIAFSLSVLIEREIFPDQKLFFTSTVVVVYVTNFIMGCTVKPLVQLLRVKKSDKRKLLMIEKLNIRLMDHVMAGIEDITGYQGYNDLRQRFQRIDQKYLKPLLIREREQIVRGKSIIKLFEKTMTREASDYIRRNSSFPRSDSLFPRNSLFPESASYSDLSKRGSMAAIFSLVTNQPSRGSFSEVESETEEATPGNRIPMPSTNSSTVLDMHALEPHMFAKVHRDDSKINHMIDDALFAPRKRVTRVKKHTLESNPNMPYNHSARRELRHLVSKAKRRHHRSQKTSHRKAPIANGASGHNISRSHSHSPDPSRKPPRNVNFGDVGKVNESPRSKEASLTEHDKGVMFYLGGTNGGKSLNEDMLGLSPPRYSDLLKADRHRESMAGYDNPAITDDPEPIETSALTTPTAAEISLPWKRGAVQDEPQSSYRPSHAPDDAPTPDDHHKLGVVSDAVRKESVGFQPRPGHQDSDYEVKSMNGHCYDSGITSDSCGALLNGVNPSDEVVVHKVYDAYQMNLCNSSVANTHCNNNNHTSNSAHYCSPVDIIITTPTLVATDPSHDTAKHNTMPNQPIEPGDSITEAPSQDLFASSKSAACKTIDTPAESQTSPVNSFTPTGGQSVSPHDTVDNAIHIINNITEEREDEEEEPYANPIPPPWHKNDTSPAEHDFHQDEAVDLFAPAPPSPTATASASGRGVFFTIGSHAELTDAMCCESAYAFTEDEDEVEPCDGPVTLPPPWQSRSEAQLPTNAASESHNTHAPHENEFPAPLTRSHSTRASLPPVWRQLSTDSVAVRSPSVAHTLDSMMPHPSCHSFRISEAESHHSLHMHMHSLIDRAPQASQSASHCDLGDLLETLCEVDVPDADPAERVRHWLIYSVADPALPVNDREYDADYKPGQHLTGSEREDGGDGSCLESVSSSPLPPCDDTHVESSAAALAAATGSYRRHPGNAGCPAAVCTNDLVEQHMARARHSPPLLGQAQAPLVTGCPPHNDDDDDNSSTKAVDDETEITEL